LLIAVVGFLIMLPFAKMPLPRVPAFIPIYEIALIIIDVITVVLLFGQYAIIHSRSLLCLACGYLFTGCIELMHALSFPGGFSQDGVVSGGMQTTPWLYIFWHAGFPLFVIAYSVLKSRERAMNWDVTYQRSDVPFSCAATLGLAVAITVLCVIAHPWLPVLLINEHSTPMLPAVMLMAWGFCIAAWFQIWRMPVKSVLDNWLMVVMCTWLFDIALSSIFNGGRYDLGFYSGRLFGCIATGFVLLKLLLANGALHARLVEAHRKELLDLREVRDISQRW